MTEQSIIPSTHLKTMLLVSTSKNIDCFFIYCLQVSLTNRILPACLPTVATDDLIGKELTVAGWGWTSFCKHACHVIRKAFVLTKFPWASLILLAMGEGQGCRLMLPSLEACAVVFLCSGLLHCGTFPGASRSFT